MSYYDKEIATINNKITKDDFEKAWIIYEKNAGKLRFYWVKLIASICLAVLLVLIIPTYTMSYASYWFPLVGLIILISIIAYLLLVKFQNISSEAEKVYISSSILCLEETITLSRDAYNIKNSFEDISGYWSELLMCIETAQLFVLLGMKEHPLFVISKSCIKSEDIPTISEFFKATFASKYKKA